MTFLVVDDDDDFGGTGTTATMDAVVAGGVTSIELEESITWDEVGVAGCCL